MDTGEQTQPFAVALILGTGELDLRVYNARNKEEALGLALMDINLQSKLNTPKTYIADFKVLIAKDGGLESVALIELRVGRRIGAIKEVRAYTGWGLKEAKQYVDALVQRYPELM
jgi:ribosomal protein L7/L12